MFLPSTFFFFIGWLVLALKVAGTVIHLGYLVIEELSMHGSPAGGYRTDNVR